MNIVIRDMKIEDADSVHRLTGELGYLLTLEQTKNFIETIGSLQDNIALVALYADTVVGWVHAFKAHRIETTPFVEIAGLVVDSNYRGHGIGKMLVDRIRKWGHQKEVDTLRLRTNTKRLEAHRFYERLGFVNTKDQKIYEMKL